MKTTMKTILPRMLLRIASAVFLMLLILTACAPASPIPIGSTSSPTVTIEPQITSREAQVQSVDIQIMNSVPAQVDAVVRGNLTEACAALGESQVRYASNMFQITVYLHSRADIGCAQVTTPFGPPFHWISGICPREITQSLQTV